MFHKNIFNCHREKEWLDLNRLHCILIVLLFFIKYFYKPEKKRKKRIREKVFNSNYLIGNYLFKLLLVQKQTYTNLNIN